MMKLPKQFEEMLKDYLLLYFTFFPMDFENDGHAIFQLAGESARSLTVKYGSPLAYRMARNLVDYAVRRYEEANGKTAA